jgi:uncharacterized protein with von Willebrand factor type A (vWA) domain
MVNKLKSNISLSQAIAMVDVSGSMSGGLNDCSVAPLHVAIALGLICG